MTFFGQWRLAWRGAVTHRRGTTLSIATLSLAVALLCLLSAQAHAVREYLAANAVYANRLGHVTIFRRGGDAALPMWTAPDITAVERAELETRLAGEAAVETMGAYLIRRGIANTGCRTATVVAHGLDTAVDAAVLAHPTLHRWDVLVERPTWTEPLTDGRASLTSALGDRLEKRTGEFVPGTAAPRVPKCDDPASLLAIRQSPLLQLLGTGPNGDIQAIDLMATMTHTTGRMFDEDVSVRLTLSDLQRLAGTDGVTYVAAYLRRGEDQARFASHLQLALDRAFGPRYVVHEATGEVLNPLDHGTISWHVTMEWFTLGLTAALVVIIAINAISMMLVERRTEIGTLMALGFRTGTVLGILQKEATIVTVGALASGASVAAVVSGAVNALGITYEPPGVVGRLRFVLALDPGTLVIRLAMVAAIAALAMAAFAMTRRAAVSPSRLLGS